MDELVKCMLILEADDPLNVHDTGIKTRYHANQTTKDLIQGSFVVFVHGLIRLPVFGSLQLL